jgi:hypothetical protein
VPFTSLGAEQQERAGAPDVSCPAGPCLVGPDGNPIELTGIAISAVRDGGMLLSNQLERNAYEVYERLTAH